MTIIQCLLMFKEIIMHLPKFILGCGGFGCLCGMLSMRMDIIERKVTKYKVYFIFEPLHYFFDYRISHSSIRTFVITVFY